MQEDHHPALWIVIVIVVILEVYEQQQMFPWYLMDSLSFEYYKLSFLFFEIFVIVAIMFGQAL